MSTQEKLFKTLVSKMICKKMSCSEERERNLLAFHGQSEFFYDMFCEAVYTLVSTNNISVISLDDFGRVQFDAAGDNCGVGQGLLCEKDVNISCDDIIVYVDLALSRLQNRLETPDGWIVPPHRQPLVRKIKLS